MSSFHCINQVRWCSFQFKKKKIFITRKSFSLLETSLIWGSCVWEVELLIQLGITESFWECLVALKLCPCCSAFPRQWLAIQKLRSKIKKKVDRKASKGRRIRWVTPSASTHKSWFYQKKALGVFYPSWLWGILADLWFLGHFLLWGSQGGILMFLEPGIRAWWMQPVSIAPVSVGKRVYWSQETPERCSNVPEPFGAVISSESQ